MIKKIAIEDYFKKISKEDKQSLQDLESQKKADLISTDSWIINTLIGDGTGKNQPGGLPRGSITEILGDEAAGKTTLAICACKMAQQQGGLAIYLDFENTFNTFYAEQLGLDLNKNKFICWTPTTFEHGVRIIEESLGLYPAIIVIDSVANMVPKAFLEGEVEAAQRLGLHAQCMSTLLKRLTPMIKETNTCLCLINQMRAVIKKSQYDHGPDKESTGGMMLKYSVVLRILMEKKEVEKINAISEITGKEDKKAVNITVKVSIIKNKFDRPYRSAPVIIRFGEGFDNLMSLAELAINTNIIKKSGAFYRFDEGDVTLFNVQGKEALRNKLKENPEITSKMRAKIRLTMTEDLAIKEKWAKEEEEEPQKTAPAKSTKGKK